MNKTEKSARVLVVDDEKGMRDMLTFNLSQEGYAVDAAENGQMALQAAGDRGYDLVICDLKMPGMDGVQTLAALKELDPDIEVIVATGYATVDTAIASMKKGAYDYIQKPFDLDELHALAEQALAKRRLKRKIEELISTRDQVVQSEKLALAIQFAAAVAHEVNNPLGVVKANMHSLRMYCKNVQMLWDTAKKTARHLCAGDSPSDQQLGRRLLDVCEGGEEEMDYQMDDAQQVVRECLDGVNRIANLVAGFQSLAEIRRSARPQAIDVKQVVEECTGAGPKQPGSGPRPIRNDFEDAPRALAVREDVLTALSNLLDYLQISRPVKTEPILVRVLTEEGRPCIRLTDSHLRLSEKERLRIFDPRIDVNIRQGRTMRMNIGLAVARQILVRNEAELVVRSDASSGSTFQILFKEAQGESP